MTVRLSLAFQDKLRPLRVLFCLLGYVVACTLVFMVVLDLWWPAGMSKADVARVAETDPTIALAQGITSTLFALLGGYAACQLGGSRGLRNSLALGVLFLAYAALNIHLHSSGEYLVHSGQFVGALVLPTLGGAIRWRWATWRGRAADVVA
jgi:hypothetical protein